MTLARWLLICDRSRRLDRISSSRADAIRFASRTRHLHVFHVWQIKHVACDRRRLGRRGTMMVGANTRNFTLRALIACVCALAVMTSLVAGASRSATAKPLRGRDFSSQFVSEAQGQNTAGTKPCQRAGLVRAGSTCSVGVFLGLGHLASYVIFASRKQTRIGPILRSVLTSQCCGPSLFRPPRIDV